MDRIIIGDIHGCFDELMDLLALAGVNADTDIISVGDLVDRGPASAETLRFFRETANARAILGNHEAKHVRWRRGELKASLSQIIAREQLGDAWEGAVDWMASLPRYLDLPEILVTHGFFQPGVPLAAQHPSVLTGTMSGERRLRAAVEGDWYARYDGEKPIAVGHALYRRDGQPLLHEGRVYGLDTGCCHGLRLTALLLPDFEIVSVPARADHWARVRAENLHLRFDGLKVEALTWRQAERTLARARRGDDPTSRAMAERVGRLLADATAGADRLLAATEAHHRAALDDLPPDLEGRALAAAYARRVQGEPLRKYLHIRRSRGLDREALVALFPGPGALVAACRRAGVS